LPNGDKILSVSDSGVLVQEGNIKKLVSFNGVSATGEVASPPPAGADLQSQLSPPSAASSGSKSVVKPAAKPEIPPVLPSPVPAEIPMPSSAVPPVPAMPKVIVSNVKPAVPETPKIISNGFDITKANKNSYTIQVVSEGNFQAVKAFVAENRFTQAQVIKIYRNSKPWYIAVTGEYPTAAAAQKRIRQFSDKLQDEGPFVRRISDVLAERVK
jgi:DamX protein